VLGASLWFAGFAGAAELKLNTQDFAPFNYEVNGWYQDRRQILSEKYAAR
jgi:hypothetical protein